MQPNRATHLWIRETLQGGGFWKDGTSLAMYAMTLHSLSASLLEDRLCHAEETSIACMDTACFFPSISGL